MRAISAVLITFNEAEKVQRALASLQGICEEIVVVDSHSTDATVDICLRYTPHVLQRPWAGYRAQKEFATRQASHEWVLSLDADEALSPELREELLRWKEEPEPPCAGYWIPRKTCFFGRWIEHTTWYPDWQLRLFRRSAGHWEGGRVHEGVRVEGRVERLRHPILHYSYSSLSEYLAQLERFSSLAAADAWEAGRRTGGWKILLLPGWVFLHNWLLRKGFREGLHGLVIACLSATSTLFKHLKLWEYQEKKRLGKKSGGAPPL